MKGESTWPVTTSFPRSTSPTVWHYLSKASSVFRHTFNQTPIPSVTLLEDQSSAGGLQDTQFYHHFPNMKRTITRIRVGERGGQKGKRWKQFFQIRLRQDLGYTISFLVWKHCGKKKTHHLFYGLSEKLPQPLFVPGAGKRPLVLGDSCWDGSWVSLSWGSWGDSFW